MNELQKCISKNQEAVVYVIDATSLLQESMECQDSWPPATKHLGQAMMATLLLQSLTEAEDNEHVSMQWMCPGIFGHVYAQARNYGEVRGTISNPRPPIADYETGLGEGLLQVRREKNGRATTSVVKAIGDISADTVEYLEKSEQRNCGLNLSVLIDWQDKKKTKFRVKSALGYLVHILPQPNEQKMNEALLRWDAQMRVLGPISKWALRPKHITMDMLRLITSEEEPKLVMTQRVKFSCNCSEERASRALNLLEMQEEIEGVLPDATPTEIRCEYCGKTYSIQPTRKKKES